MMIVTDILNVEQQLDGIEGVIFDLDDTLYSEREYVQSGYRKIAEWLENPIIEDRLWEVFLRGGKAIDEVIELPKRAAALQIYRNQMPEIHLYPGVREMLERIAMCKKVGIITDGRPEGQRNKIAALHLDALVDDIIVTDELGGVQYRKPCSIAFSTLQKCWQLPFERMVYIGDNPRKDFQACEQLGMRWIYFKNSAGLYSV